MRIFLIGYMGSGKTTVGKKIAGKMKFDFLDMDDYIEETAGKQIYKIFAEDGENKFRTLEKEAIQHFITLNNIIISTGGGAPCFFNNMETLNANGITIYLKMTVPALVSRLTESKTRRPLITGKSKEDLENYISKTLEKRAPYYNRAKVIINGESIDIGSLINTLHAHC